MFGNSHFVTGLISLVLSLLLFFVAIPFGITSPSNVSNIFLAPTFWPQVLSVLLGLTGIALLFSSRSAPKDENEENSAVAGSKLRLFLLAILMVAYIIAIPIFGLVWTSMVVFVLLAILVKSPHPVIAVIAGIVIPLVLYLFFAHVAGMAIPQGEFVRLP